MIQQKPRKPRKIGQISQRILPLPTTALSPPQTHNPNINKIKDLTVNNINLYNETYALQFHRDSLYEQYLQIIAELEIWNKELSQRNFFLETDRTRLIEQNTELRRKIDSYAEINSMNCMTMNQTCKNNQVLFEVIDEKEEETLGHVFHREEKNGKGHCKEEVILEQSDLQIDQFHQIKGHFYHDDAVDNKFVLNSYSELMEQQDQHLSQQSQQRTPCLHNHHSLIQSKSTLQQSSLRIFYLLLLQQPSNIIKLEQLLQFQSQLENPIFPLYKNDNKIWNNVLTDFFDKIRANHFEDEKDIIEFINNNVLIDMLLVECLKSVTAFGREDDEEGAVESEEGSKILFYSQSSFEGLRDNQYHEVIFRGLANYFEMDFEEDRERKEYRFYQNEPQNIQHHTNDSQGQSDELLLQSRQIQRSLQNQQIAEQQLEISLHPQPQQQVKNEEIMKSRQEPHFRIKYDQSKSYFRVSVCIRGTNRDDYFETCTSFDEEEAQQKYQIDENYEESILSKEHQYENVINSGSALQVVDTNRGYKYPYSKGQDYLQYGRDPYTSSQIVSQTSSQNHED